MNFYEKASKKAKNCGKQLYLLKKRNLSYNYKLFLQLKRQKFFCSLKLYVLSGPQNDLVQTNIEKNIKKQSKIAEKSDIREKVVCKVVSMWFYCIEKI